jgi:hypothetical protein
MADQVLAFGETDDPKVLEARVDTAFLATVAFDPGAESGT